MEYECKCCEYRTTHQTNFKKHLETNKHKQKAAKTDPLVCKHCEKVFKFKQSMYHHMKHTCKKNKDRKNKELLIEEANDMIRLLRQERDELQKKIERLSVKIDNILKI